LLGRLVSRAQQGQCEDRPLLPLHPWSWAIGQLLCHCGPARRFALKLHARRRRHPGESRNAERALINVGAVDPGAS
jgi:hypothetical protein